MRLSSPPKRLRAGPSGGPQNPGNEEGCMTRKLAAAAAAALSLWAAAPAFAGFRIQTADLEFPEDVTIYWFQAGKARVDGALEGLTVIVDVKSGEGWLIDAVQALRRRDARPDSPRSWKLEAALDNDTAAGDSAGERGRRRSAKPLAVEVKDLGAGERLQGYDTRRYQVLVDGELLEELWLAPKIAGRQRGRPGRVRGRHAENARRRARGWSGLRGNRGLPQPARQRLPAAAGAATSSARRARSRSPRSRSRSSPPPTSPSRRDSRRSATPSCSSAKRSQSGWRS